MSYENEQQRLAALLEDESDENMILSSSDSEGESDVEPENL